MNPYTLQILTEAQACHILTWRYPLPYDFYNPPDDDHKAHYVSQFVKPELNFHSVLNANKEMMGFCSYGLDGQVLGGDYSTEALDIGLGMDPRYTGKGLGLAFFAAILNHAESHFGADKIRLTVANFNLRALRLYEKFGFLAESDFIDKRNYTAYTILTADIDATRHKKMFVSSKFNR